MPRSYFQFRQFTVDQDMCAIKVCTDACIFGAYIDPENSRNILDIGTGTGLLSLMLAQRSIANIYAVEIDKNTCTQAIDNVNQSPWKDRIQVTEADIKNWKPESNLKFDLIVSNPPFFQNHLKSSEQTKNKAKHDDTLTLEALITSVENLLDPTGKFYVLLPPYESALLETKMQLSGFNLFDRLEIKNKVEKPVFRVISGYSKQDNLINQLHELIITETNGGYSNFFKRLLGEYYLRIEA